MEIINTRIFNRTYWTTYIQYMQYADTNQREYLLQTYADNVYNRPRPENNIILYEPLKIRIIESRAELRNCF